MDFCIKKEPDFQIRASEVLKPQAMHFSVYSNDYACLSSEVLLNSADVATRQETHPKKHMKHEFPAVFRENCWIYGTCTLNFT